jgi:hypothetical protein
MIDPLAEQLLARRLSLVADALDAFRRSMDNTTPKHHQLTMTRVKRLVEASGAKTLGDLHSAIPEPDSISGLVYEEAPPQRTERHEGDAQLPAECQACLASRTDALRSSIDTRNKCPVRPAAFDPAGLAGEEELVASISQGPTNERLVVTVAVRVGGVDEIDTEVEGVVKRGGGFRLVGSPVGPGHAPAAQPDR